MKFSGCIYDLEAEQWYELSRGLFGGLRLKKITYRGLRRFPIDGDMIIHGLPGSKYELLEPTKPPNQYNPVKVKKVKP